MAKNAVNIAEMLLVEPSDRAAVLGDALIGVGRWIHEEDDRFAGLPRGIWISLIILLLKTLIQILELFERLKAEPG